MRLPLNEQVIVGYQESKWSPYGVVLISYIDIREPCKKENCQYQEEHYTFDGQIFFRSKV